jgi:hypothetical protein
MKHLPPNGGCATRKLAVGEQASARTVLLLGAFFLLGIAVSAFLFYAISRGGLSIVRQNTGATPTIRLSDKTKAVLGRLDSPLEIRFHESLDPATVPQSLIAFASRVDELLAAYQQAAGNKIKLEKFNSSSDADADAAFADGIPPFNLDKGAPCWLGIALVLDGRKESLPRLSPEWEPALEADLTRAIERLLNAPGSVPVPVAVSQINTNALQEVKALVPDLGSVSEAEATRILREAALKDLTATAKEMEAKLQEAEQRLTQAQQSGSEAEQQAAKQHLLQLRAERDEKLKRIAARSNAQIETLQQLKAAR